MSLPATGSTAWIAPWSSGLGSSALAARARMRVRPVPTPWLPWVGLHVAVHRGTEIFHPREASFLRVLVSTPEPRTVHIAHALSAYAQTLRTCLEPPMSNPVSVDLAFPRELPNHLRYQL